MKNILSIFLAAGVWLLSTTVVQAWPTRPVTLVIPFSAGGGTDAIARTMQERLSKELGQPVVIEYRTGAGGLIALNHVINAKDDHKVLFTTTDVVITAAATDPNFALSDMQAVSVLVRSPLILATRPDGPYQNFRVVMQRASTDHITFGSPSMGTVSHLVLEKLLPRFTDNPIIVQYKGGNPMATDTAGGHNDISISSYGGTFQSWIEGARLVPVLVFNDTRLKDLPNTPTAKELGIDLVASASFTVFGPKNMTRDQTRSFNLALTTILKDPAVSTALIKRGNEIMALDESASDRWTQQELRLWLPLLKKVNNQNNQSR